jgi:hypothetical protein
LKYGAGTLYVGSMKVRSDSGAVSATGRVDKGRT